jgi:hypothetical protein
MTTSYRKQQQIAKSNQSWLKKETKRPIPRFRRFKENINSYFKIGVDELGEILNGR